MAFLLSDSAPNIATPTCTLPSLDLHILAYIIGHTLVGLCSQGNLETFLKDEKEWDGGSQEQTSCNSLSTSYG